MRRPGPRRSANPTEFASSASGPSRQRAARTGWGARTAGASLRERVEPRERVRQSVGDDHQAFAVRVELERRDLGSCGAQVVDDLLRVAAELVVVTGADEDRDVLEHSRLLD